MRRRPLLLALLALTLPLPAFALQGGGSHTPAGPVALSVSASLGECGLAETAIVCEIQAGWDAVEGADDYTVSVTRADGSVVDYGSVGGTGTSLWVPYVGSGSYVVQVTAWGTPPGSDDRHVIARERAVSGGAARAAAGGPGHEPAGEDDEGAGTTEPAEPDGGGEPGEGQPAEPTAPAEPEPPACVPAPAEPDPATEEPPAAEDAQTGAALEDVSAATQAELAEQAELPEAVTCP